MSKNNRTVLKRYRNTFVLSGVAIATLFTTGMVGFYMLKRWLYNQQLRITEQHFAKEQIKRRFQQTQQDSSYTIYELFPVLALVLNKELDLEEIIDALKGKKSFKPHLYANNADNSSEEQSNNTLNTSNLSHSQSDSNENVDNLQRLNKSKAELWNELKLKGLIKLIIIVYTTTMLLLLTRLQLNILARREYLDTAIKVAVEKKTNQKDTSLIFEWIKKIWSIEDKGEKPLEISGNNTNLLLEQQAHPSNKNRYINEQAFLSLSWWLLNRGWLQYKSIIERHVTLNFTHLNPRDTMTPEEFGNKLNHVFYSINKELFVKDNSQDLLTKSLLPDVNMELFVLEKTLDSDALEILYENNTIMRQLIHETTKCIQSAASCIVLESLINESFQFVMENLEAMVSKKSKKTQANENLNSKSPFQIALYSVSCKDCCSEMLRHGITSMDNNFLQRLDSVPEVDDLSASVYSNFGF